MTFSVTLSTSCSENTLITGELQMLKCVFDVTRWNYTPRSNEEYKGYFR